jgi:hypothetical protein
VKDSPPLQAKTVTTFWEIGETWIRKTTRMFLVKMKSYCCVEFLRIVLGTDIVFFLEIRRNPGMVLEKVMSLV